MNDAMNQTIPAASQADPANAALAESAEIIWSPQTAETAQTTEPALIGETAQTAGTAETAGFASAGAARPGRGRHAGGHRTATLRPGIRRTARHARTRPGGGAARRLAASTGGAAMVAIGLTAHAGI